jgi:hypothetical protein
MSYILYYKQNVGDSASYRISMTGPGTEKATYKVSNS